MHSTPVGRKAGSLLPPCCFLRFDLVCRGECLYLLSQINGLLYFHINKKIQFSTRSMISSDLRGEFTNTFLFSIFCLKATTVTHDWLDDLCWRFSGAAPNRKAPPFSKNDHFIRAVAMLRLNKFLCQSGFAKWFRVTYLFF